MSALVPLATDLERFTPTLDEAKAEAVRLKGKAKADSTVRAYNARWAEFCRWCDTEGLLALPAPEAVAAAFIGHLSLIGAKPSTVYGYTAAIRYHHRQARQPNPYEGVDVREVIEGHVRDSGAAVRKVDPLRTKDIRRIVSVLDHKELADLRDRAMLLVAFSGALRRSELLAMRVDHLERVPGKGYRVHLPKTKTDQRGEGSERFIREGEHFPTCPVTALNEWLTAADITDGYLWRPVRGTKTWGPDRPMAGESFAQIIKRRVAAVNLDPAKFAGHSTRRGFATQAAEGGVPRQQIMKDGGWRSSTVVDGYIAAVEGFDAAASGNLGL